MSDELPPIRPFRASPGGQLRAEDVIGRDSDIERIWATLETASVRLNEPRRLGKTSVLTKMAEDPPVGWVCVKVSVQGISTTEALAEILLRAVRHHQRLPRKAREAVKGFLTSASASAEVNGVTLQLAGAFKGRPLSALEEALRDVSKAMDLAGDRLVLACDEVPDMLMEVAKYEGHTAASNILAVLRRFREDSANSSIRWLLTGSVGLHHVLKVIGAGDDLVGDLDTVTIGPLNDAWSTWLAESLLYGAGLAYDNDTPMEIARVTGGIPYLAHLIVARVREQGRDYLHTADVDSVFVQAAADLDHSHQSTHLLTRLETYYGPDAPAAEWILDRLVGSYATRSMLAMQAAAERLPLALGNRLRMLLYLLVLDHYLAKTEDGNYAWRYRPLMRLWQIRRS